MERRDVSDRWWVIHEDEIRRSLRQVADGDAPDVVMLELTANSEPGDDPEANR